MCAANTMWVLIKRIYKQTLFFFCLVSIWTSKKEREQKRKRVSKMERKREKKINLAWDSNSKWNIIYLYYIYK